MLALMVRFVRNWLGGIEYYERDKNPTQHWHISMVHFVRKTKTTDAIVYMHKIPMIQSRKNNFRKSGTAFIT